MVALDLYWVSSHRAGEFCTPIGLLAQIGHTIGSGMAHSLVFCDAPKTLKVFSPFHDTLLRGIFAKINDNSRCKPLGSSKTNAPSIVHAASDTTFECSPSNVTVWTNRVHIYLVRM